MLTTGIVYNLNCAASAMGRFFLSLFISTHLALAKERAFCYNENNIFILKLGESAELSL